MGITSLIDKYLDYLAKEKKVSPYTLKDYRYYLNYFRTFLDDDNPALLANPAKLTKYRAQIKNFKKSTQNYFLIALRSFFVFLNSIGVETVDPDQINLAEHPKEITEVLDPESINKLLALPDGSSIEGLRDKSIIWLLFATGLKISELSQLNIDSIQWEKGLLGLGQSRKIELPQELVDFLKKYLSLRKDTFKPLFIRYKGTADGQNFGEKMRLSPRSIERMVEKYAKMSGFKIKATPQVLRHSFAANLLIQGEKLPSVQRKLGHKSLHSSKRYQKLFENFAKKSTP
jgi:site-specific recombinase XerD